MQLSEMVHTAENWSETINAMHSGERIEIDEGVFEGVFDYKYLTRIAAQRVTMAWRSPVGATKRCCYSVPWLAVYQLGAKIMANEARAAKLAARSNKNATSTLRDL